MAGFRKAKAEQAALKMGIYGPPGSGKTFTSLLIAEGLAKLSGKGVALATFVTGVRTGLPATTSSRAFLRS